MKIKNCTNGGPGWMRFCIQLREPILSFLTDQQSPQSESDKSIIAPILIECQVDGVWHSARPDDLVATYCSIFGTR